MRQAASATELEEVRELFREYASSLEISLCFQNFEEELATLPGKYAAPRGRLILALEQDSEPGAAQRGSSSGQAAGCVGLRPLEPGVCEMKRLFVRPTWRGMGLGRLLAEKIISAAAEIGYRRVRLDTLDSLKPAIELYRSLGFRRIAPYYENPNDRVVFMELLLGGHGGGDRETRSNLAA